MKVTWKSCEVTCLSWFELFMSLMIWFELSLSLANLTWVEFELRPKLNSTQLIAHTGCCTLVAAFSSPYSHCCSLIASLLSSHSHHCWALVTMLSPPHSCQCSPLLHSYHCTALLLPHSCHLTVVAALPLLCSCCCTFILSCCCALITALPFPCPHYCTLITVISSPHSCCSLCSPIIAMLSLQAFWFILERNRITVIYLILCRNSTIIDIYGLHQSMTLGNKCTPQYRTT